LPFRFPVQWVNRPDLDYRGFAGTIAGGSVKPGDRVVVLPSGRESEVSRIVAFDGDLELATAGQSVTLTLADEIDVSRGDMIARRKNQPHVGQDIEAMVCWMSDTTWLRQGAKLGIKHTTRWARALVKDLQYQLDVNTLHRYEDAVGLSLNEIGRVTLRTTLPLFYDEYRRNRTTGSFILVDEASNTTVGAGMILAPASE
jgi:bifunctional enzyme CysN/CysC